LTCLPYFEVLAATAASSLLDLKYDFTVPISKVKNYSDNNRIEIGVNFKIRK
jgi:hypothetical protein